MENGGVYLKKGEGRSMKAGGPWVYDNEVERIEGEPLDGDVVPSTTTTVSVWARAS